MNEIIKFLQELQANNNREWFETNKSRYKGIQEQFNGITQQLIDGIELFDPSVRGVTVKDCTYRIYRDVRFSPNKDPYKTHIGAYVCPRGKKSGMAGYYLHLEPGNSILAAGLHCPLPSVIRSVREEIFSNSSAFLEALAIASDFTVDTASSLKRVPKEYPTDSPMAQYLKLKEFDLVAPITINTDTLAMSLEKFRTVRDFNAILNKAVEFATSGN